MKTSRLASPANPSGALHPRARTTANSIGNPCFDLISRVGPRLCRAIVPCWVALGSLASAVPWVPAPESDIAGYLVSYGTTSGEHSTTVDVGMGNKADLPGLLEGHTYYVVISAYSADGMMSEPSAEIVYQVPVTTTDPVNQAPVAVSKSLTTAEDAPVAAILSASDADGNPLTYTIVSGPVKGTLSGSAPNLTYTPFADSTGTDSFTYKANDGKVDSNIATVTITVTPVNDAPVASAKSVSTPEDAPVAIALAASDKEGNPLSYTIVRSPAAGSLSGSAPNLTYTPFADSNGSDSFTYKANDGAADSNVAIVSITVAPVNDAPVANAGSVTTVEATTVGVQLGATDKDSTALTYSVVTGPANGMLSGTAPDLTYTPVAGFSGTDSITFQANDGSLDSNVATVSITVTPKEAGFTNHPPVFKSNPITRAAGVEGKSYEGASLADSATDPDTGDSVSYSIISGPSWLAVSAAGKLSGTPPSGAEGMNRFIIRATDEADAFAEAQLLIEIAAADLPLPWETEQFGGNSGNHRASHKSGSFMLESAGNLAGPTDAGIFVWQTLSGDGEIIARVNPPDDGGNSSRAGVMIRDSLAANSRHIFIGVNGSGGFRWVRRASKGSPSVMKKHGSGSNPNAWLRLVRKGETISAYKSANGSDWTRVGTSTVEFGNHCYIGLVMSGGQGKPTTAAFRNVKVNP